MKITHFFLPVLLFSILAPEIFAEIPLRKGWWKFDNGENIHAQVPGFGLPLIPVGNIYFENGPMENNGAVLVESGSYYKMTHQIAIKNGEPRVNEYSLQFDFKIYKSGIWHSFFQTSENNTGDADLFINPGGEIGVAAVGYSSISIIPDQWYRLIVSVKNGNQFNLFLDGKLLLKGTVQIPDGRFSLGNTILIFADDNGEDGDILCSELAIWDKALTTEEASELGGYTHTVPELKTRIPFLQNPGVNSMTICWHDSNAESTKVIYGTDSLHLNFETPGISEFVTEPYYWHSVKLTSLQSNTRYFYKVHSGNNISGLYSFKTLPGSDYTGKIRFIFLSDTHSSDTTMFGKIASKARATISKLYGKNIENHVNGIIHSGDIVLNGNSPGQYHKQFFDPLSVLSTNIPTTVVAGNHEIESPVFYQYLKVDDLSAYPAVPDLNEKLLQIKVCNTLFLGLNTNITKNYGVTIKNWVNAVLKQAEEDVSIDFVFLFFHHPPMSELWDFTNSGDAGTAFVRDELLPVIKKYSKVQQLNYGHTHGFERGTIISEQKDADFRIICGGGGGGYLDPWAEGENRDFNEISVCISNYIFQILEIDVANKSYENTVYSLGTLNKPKNGEIIDHWYKKTSQGGPEKPLIVNVEQENKSIRIQTSEFSGQDSLMSVHLQAFSPSGNQEILKDTLIQKVNIYGIDSQSNPVDLHENIDIYDIKTDVSDISEKAFYLRARYRDNNLKWSEWSKPYYFATTNSEELKSHEKMYFQNFPNPFTNNTVFEYETTESGEVILKIYDINYRIVTEKNLGYKLKGKHTYIFSEEALRSGTYICELKVLNDKAVKSIIKLD